MMKTTVMCLCAALALTACQSQSGAGIAMVDPVPVSRVNTSMDIEGQILASVNAERARKGLQPLVYNRLLTRAALIHAQDLEHSGIFSHTGSDGSTAGKRARRVGYDFCIVGENLSMGYASLEAAMQGWMTSKGHRDNILNRRFTEIGIGIAEGARYVTVFGSRC